MIQVIVSHDVDHLFGKDHWFRDLIYPKMWIRTTIELFSRSISLKEWWLRNISCFRKNRHHIDELMDFDEKHGVPSTFFFGMRNGLGMSYKPEEAKSVIQSVCKRGFAVGVHGIEYQDHNKMQQEYDTFVQTTGFIPCGIRMHYVRFDSTTFEKLNRIGYLFDTTEFNKTDGGTRKAPYKVGRMWEFPLTIMDGYVPQDFAGAQKKTLEILDLCMNQELKYISILFHDYQFCDDYFDMYKWYVWLIDYLKMSEYFSFVSYAEAIGQLEAMT